MPPSTVYLIELFSGSSSVAKAIKKSLPPGWTLEVHSVDIHPKYNPTTATDILQWRYRKVLKDFLANAKDTDVIWAHASPPCTEYSKAKTTAPRDLPLADSLATKAFEIILYSGGLAPDPRRFFWTVENPVGLMRTRSFMQELEPYLHTTSYCKWGKPYRKDTDIWTNVQDLVLPICRQGSYCAHKKEHGVHRATAQILPSSSSGPDGPVGSGSGENVYPLPPRLTAHVFKTALKSLDGPSTALKSLDSAKTARRRPSGKQLQT